MISWGRRLLGGALGLFTDAASVLLGLLVMFAVGLYLAARPVPVVDWSVRLFPPGQRPRVRHILVEVRASLLSWLKGRLLSMAVVGGLSIAALYTIGIPGALFLGLFAGLVSFVPYIGPIISVIPPALLALDGDQIDALWVVLAYLAIQQVETYLITPLIMEKTASLHPAVAIAAVTLLGAAFGLLGALLSLPAAVEAGVLVRELWFRRLETQEPEAAGD
jgi:predicted PurR-regulated permease PerM